MVLKSYFSLRAQGASEKKEMNILAQTTIEKKKASPEPHKEKSSEEGFFRL